MRTFDHFPENAVCPVCGTSEDKKCVLIAIQGTQEGNISEAAPVHADCIDPANMLFNKEVGVIYIRASKGE